MEGYADQGTGTDSTDQIDLAPRDAAGRSAVV